MSNNTVSFIGRVSQGPTARIFNDTNNKLVKFAIAVKEFSSKTDKPKDMFLDIDCWNGLGDRVLKTVTVGREIKIDGRLALNSYTKEKDGTTFEVTKPVVKLSSFHLCGKKPDATDKDSDE